MSKPKSRDTLKSILDAAVRPARVKGDGWEWSIGEHAGLCPGSKKEAKAAVIEWARKEVEKRKNGTAEGVKRRFPEIVKRVKDKA